MLRYHLGWIDQQGQPRSDSASLNFQPALALAACDALGGDFRNALPSAASVELIYNFTLVHSDVQAGRAEPGDRPSIWWVWGPAQAINAGDGLHSLGRTTIMRLAKNGVPADRVLKAVKSLDQACLTLCEGQYMDLEFQDQMMVSTAAYMDMIGRKAGALASCAALTGALTAGSSDEVCDSFGALGRNMGMAWQIARDIDDLWGKHGDGMTPSNVLNKKKSLPLIHTLENSSVSVKRELGAIYMKRVLEANDIAKMVEILDGADARQASQTKAQELVDQAIDGLTGVSGVSQEGMDNLASLGQWAAEGGR
ncbi:MAG: polyprenyl synthetase family protein [SAR202 cluster bacterium]|nr:polyprenyl synthetase family protein [SAR202 cluster bacterium]